MALAIGDGFFVYGVPSAALWSVVKYRAPFLTVVCQNQAYSTGTTGVGKLYPEGFSVRNGEFEGEMIDPAPDFAKLAESVGAYGHGPVRASA